MRKIKYLVLICIVAMMLIVPASASSISTSGQFGMPSEIVQTRQASNIAGVQSVQSVGGVVFGSIENVGNVKAILYYSINNPSAYFLLDAGAPNSSFTTFTSSVGTGTIGYQRTYTSGGSLAYGVVYVTFDNFDRGTMTGFQKINLTYSAPALRNLTVYGARVEMPDTTQYFGYLTDPTETYSFSGSAPNDHTDNNVAYQYAATYTAQTTSSGVNGTIYKAFINGLGQPVLSPSEAMVFSNLDGTVIATDTTSTFTNLSFNSPLTRDITMSILTPDGQRFNATFSGISNYTISANPVILNPNQSTVITLSSDIGVYSGFSQYSISCTPSFFCNDAGNDPLYQYIGGTWYQWNNSAGQYTISKGTSLPTQVTLYGLTSQGINNITAVLWPSDTTRQPYQTSTTVTVNPSGLSRKLVVNVIDAGTNAFIIGATASTRLPSNSWVNKTVTTGSVVFDVPDGSYVAYTATATGYAQPITQYVLVNEDSTVTVAMKPPGATPAAGYASLDVYVTANAQPLSGAVVSIAGNGTASTSATGTATFNLSANFVYSVTVSKAGYISQTKTTACGASTCPSLYFGLIAGQMTTATPRVTNVPGDTTSSPQGNADNAIALLASYVYTFMEIAVIIVFMWLFWIFIFEMTGGEVIGKLIRRGRGRR